MAKPSSIHSGNKTLVKIGNNIRKLRLHKRLSQEALALNSGIDRSYLGGIERGEHNVAVINLEKIAQALEIPIANLFK
jgi:transcriptional regulator with XRE-family HTH domain